jgi:predicted acylesterase/phospholipase RssA
MKQKSKRRPRVGIALGGGTVRGLAFIGILRVLEEEGIQIDYITGVSAGAVIAAAYASGRSVDEIEKIAHSTKWKELLDFTKPKKGFIRGKKIEKYLRSIFLDNNFEHLKIPLRIVATEVDTGKKAVFYRGDVTSAVRASISLPAIFTPFRYGKCEYMDGSLVDPIPFDELKKMGADVVIAIDLTVDLAESYVGVVKKNNYLQMLKKKFLEHQIKYIHEYVDSTKSFFIQKLMPKFNLRDFVLEKMGQRLPRIMEVYLQSTEVLMNELTIAKLRSPEIDLVIKPQFKGVSWVELDKIDYIIKAGEEAARRDMVQIRKLIK